jgi:hypothetical protein
MMLCERVTVADLDSEHFPRQLLDGLRWALADAQLAEQPSATSDRRESSVAEQPARRRALPREAK